MTASAATAAKQTVRLRVIFPSVEARMQRRVDTTERRLIRRIARTLALEVPESW
jgi:hypothetical protein